jgi:hypothetical protein
MTNDIKEGAKIFLEPVMFMPCVLVSTVLPANMIGAQYNSEDDIAKKAAKITLAITTGAVSAFAGPLDDSYFNDFAAPCSFLAKFSSYLAANLLFPDFIFGSDDHSSHIRDNTTNVSNTANTTSDNFSHIRGNTTNTTSETETTTVQKEDNSEKTPLPGTIEMEQSAYHTDDVV